MSCADTRFRPFVRGLALSHVFNEPVSISSVYDVAGLPTLMTIVYAIAVFVIEKLDARMLKLKVVSFPASLACPRARGWLARARPISGIVNGE